VRAYDTVLGCERATPGRTSVTRRRRGWQVPMFAIWNRCQEAIAARITCNSTQHITGCGARCTTGGHDAVMSGEHSQRHTQVGVGIRGVVVAMAVLRC
jgi:hypothetical protein